VLEIRSEQTREPLGRQVDLLEEERLSAGQPETLEIEGRRAELEIEGRGDSLTCRLRPSGDQARRRIESAGQHLIGEAAIATEVQVEARMENERSAPSRPLDPLLASQLRERAPDGDQAAAISLSQFAFGREPVARPPLIGIESGDQVEVDLVVERDGTELEPEAGHRRAWDLLRAARMVITL
jgi:hypothetical protein